MLQQSDDCHSYRTWFEIRQKYLEPIQETSVWWLTQLQVFLSARFQRKYSLQEISLTLFKRQNKFNLLICLSWVKLNNFTRLQELIESVNDDKKIGLCLNIGHIDRLSWSFFIVDRHQVFRKKLLCRKKERLGLLYLQHFLQFFLFPFISFLCISRKMT